ncbi:hypothetical protein Q8A67_001514 [Cirrhinus molitorella]|uniref:Butyrophilin-like protein 2 n=2 Tax=Cirrhinus molitorella TaxID=172907 RepID=A0AA88U169_9TELE|nr:hypothetical protein Q8A67_001514 [Cirrhinus molitorella]
MQPDDHLKSKDLKMHRMNSVLMSALLMITDGLTVHGPSGPLVAPLGSSVVLPCSVDKPLPMEDLEVEWRKTDPETLVHMFQDGEIQAEIQQQEYQDRAHFFTDQIQHGNFSLRLDNLRAEDEGQYTCTVHSQQDSGETVIEIQVDDVEHLRVSGSSRSISASVGEDVTLSCSIDSHITSEDLEVSWKKTDEDEDIVVLLYQNNEALPEASNDRYRDRVEFFTDEIPKGNFSLRLKSVRTEDKGVYMCEVFAGGLSGNTTAVLGQLGFSALHIMVMILCISASGSALLLCCLIYCRSTTKEILMRGKFIPLGDSVDLPCWVDKSLLENSLKVEWRRADSETLVHLYEDGKSRAEEENKEYHKRAHILKKKIKDGNFSLRLKKLRAGDEGVYRCKVYRDQDCVHTTNTELKLGFTVKHSRHTPVHLGSSVVLPFYNDKPSTMKGLKVEWRKKDLKDLVHLYEDGESRADEQQQDYQDRAHLFIEHLKDGNFSLRLDKLRAEDEGQYESFFIVAVLPAFLTVARYDWDVTCGQQMGCSSVVRRSVYLTLILLVSAVLVFLYIIALENEKDRVGWACMIAFLQLLWSLINFTWSFRWALPRLVPVYVFGSVGVVLLNSVALMIELIMKTVNGEGVTGDMRITVFSSEFIFTLFLMVLMIFEPWITPCLQLCQNAAAAVSDETPAGNKRGTDGSSVKDENEDKGTYETINMSIPAAARDNEQTDDVTYSEVSSSGKKPVKSLTLHKWDLLERYPVLLLAKRTSNGFSAECFCPWKMDTEDAQDAFVTIKRLYESLLNVAIADKAANSKGETANSTQTETPPLDDTEDPAAESTPLLPCNDKAANSMGETPAALDNTVDPAAESTPESETLLLPPASSSLASPISFMASLSSPMALSIAPPVSPLIKPVFKFSQASPTSFSLASPLPPSSTLSASSKLTPKLTVSTEQDSPDSVSSLGKRRQLKWKAAPSECPIHKDSTNFPYKKILRKRIREGHAEVLVQWHPCSGCGTKWKNSWEPQENIQS